MQPNVFAAATALSPLSCTCQVQQLPYPKRNARKRSKNPDVVNWTQTAEILPDTINATADLYITSLMHDITCTACLRQRTRKSNNVFNFVAVTYRNTRSTVVIYLHNIFHATISPVEIFTATIIQTVSVCHTQHKKVIYTNSFLARS